VIRSAYHHRITGTQEDFVHVSDEIYLAFYAGKAVERIGPMHARVPFQVSSGWWMFLFDREMQLLDRCDVRLPVRGVRGNLQGEPTSPPART
jgi:hypothetical protein